MRLGVTRHGPSAPLACQLGKYETLTSTGVPTRDTWKLMDESVCVTAVTLVVPAGLTVGWMSPTGVLGHSGGPPCASSTFHWLGLVYQRNAGPSCMAFPSQLDGPGLPPERTTGSLARGVTSGEFLIR